MLQLCMPAQHEADLRSLKILALKLKIEANHSRSQISSLQVTGSLPRKVLLFPRLIIIFPLRWISSLTENSITNRAKLIYSPTKLLYFHWEKKIKIKKIFLPHTPLKVKYFWHAFHQKPKFFDWKYGCSPSGDVLVHWLPFPQGKGSIEKKSTCICTNSVFFSFPHTSSDCICCQSRQQAKDSPSHSPSKMQWCPLHNARYPSGHGSSTRDQEAKGNFPITLS